MRKCKTTEKVEFVRIINGSNYPDLLSLQLDVFIEAGYSWSKMKRRLQVLSDISYRYEKSAIQEKYDEYFSSGQYEKLRIRYGEERVVQYKSALSKRPRAEVVSNLTKSYWINKGYTLDEAISAISKIQSSYAKRRSPASYANHSAKIKISLDYWTSRGYTVEEAELLRSPYLLECSTSLEGFIARHGEQEGTAKYFSKIETYKESMRNNLSNRRTGGTVSKESIKFFIPLYKYCRQLGISREDIYFGINGSREFFLRKPQKKNEGKFLDFCIPSLKIVVEYNGTFWHPRKREDWNSPFVDYDTALAADNLRYDLIESRMFDCHIVWSDDDLNAKQNEIRKDINERYTHE